MKRKLLISILAVILSSQLMLNALADEVYYEENIDHSTEYNDDGDSTTEHLAVVDTSESIISGGDRIHIIKVFEQKSGCDALLIESEGHFGMVDVGIPYDYIHYLAHDEDNSIVNYLKNYGVEKLDFIILTHMHLDHVGSFENVLRCFPVDTVYVRTFDLPEYIRKNSRTGRVSKICDEYRVKKAELKDGQEIPFWHLTIKAFNLDDEYHGTSEDGGENNNCVGLLVTDAYGHKAFLAADINNYDGDEDRMVDLHYDELKDVDYLKVGHHGEAGSSTYDFIQMLNPIYVAVTGWKLGRDEDPFRPGHKVYENYLGTRALNEDSVYFMYESENGIVFTMGEELSINNTYKSPSHFGDANKTLSVFYNANGGYISQLKEEKYRLDEEGNICVAKEDKSVDKDVVEQRSLEGDVAPLYYYDREVTLEKADEFGLVKDGYTFTGKWENKEDKEQRFDTDIKYGVFDIAPRLEKASCTITLLAKWRPNRYSIVFNANGGYGKMKTMGCLYDKTSKITHNSFRREGYVFKGWNTKPDGTGKAYTDKQEIKNITAKDGKKIILYAQWERISRDRRDTIGI